MGNVLVPKYTVYINGKELDANYYQNIHKVSIKETSIGCCKCALYLNDPNMLFIEGSMVVESTPIKIVIEMGGQERVFEGYVSVLDATFPKDGTPTATINCMDKTHLMNRKYKTRSWENCTVSSVAEQIYREYGFKVKVTDSVKKLETIQQSNETDIAFITKLVDDIETKHFLTYVEGETAYFVERQAPSPSAQLNYRQSPYNLLSFNPRINKESKKEPYPQNDIDLKTLKTVSTVVNPTVHNLGSKQVTNSATRK